MTRQEVAFSVERSQGCRGTREPLRVLHLIETGGPGGAERMLLDLVRNLGRAYQSTVGLLKTGWLHSQVQALGVSCELLDGHGMGDLGVMSSILGVVKRRSIALIHAHEFYMSVLGAAVSRWTGIPLVVTVHGKAYYSEKSRRLVLYRMVAAQSAAVVAVSGDLERFFCARTGVQPDRVRVIHNGIDVEGLSHLTRQPQVLESVGIPSDAVIVGSVGNLYRVKGHVHLIRAARTVMRAAPNAHLVILGRGGLKDELAREAELLGIGDRVHLLGHQDDVRRWLGAMNVFALPSLSEGLPLSLLEAMAAGLCPVVTAVGGMPEVVRDGQTGFLVPPEDPARMADKILFLLQHPDVARRMGQAARESMRAAFSLERMLADYRHLYGRALAPAARRRLASTG